MNLNISVELSSTELEKIIKEAIEKACPGYKANSVDWSISQHRDYRGETSGHYINNVSVKMSQNTEDQPGCRGFL